MRAFKTVLSVRFQDVADSRAAADRLSLAFGARPSQESRVPCCSMRALHFQSARTWSCERLVETVLAGETVALDDGDGAAMRLIAQLARTACRRLLRM